jgi:hypothetical protein
LSIRRTKGAARPPAELSLFFDYLNSDPALEGPSGFGPDGQTVAEREPYPNIPGEDAGASVVGVVLFVRRRTHVTGRGALFQNWCE